MSRGDPTPSVHPRIAQELLRHASSKITMGIYSHVSAAQQREPVEVLQRALAESHFESDLGLDSGGQDWANAAETGQFERESGSGGRTRTCDQAVNSRPLYQLSYAGTVPPRRGARGRPGLSQPTPGAVKNGSEPLDERLAGEEDAGRHDRRR